MENKELKELIVRLLPTAGKLSPTEFERAVDRMIKAHELNGGEYGASRYETAVDYLLTLCAPPVAL